MKHISEVLARSSSIGIGSNQNLTNSTTDEQRAKSVALRRRMIDLYGHFASMYGYAWTSSQLEGEAQKVVDKKWCGVLGRLSDDQVKKSLQQILYAKTEYQKFPPNPQQFYELGLSNYSEVFTAPLVKVEDQHKCTISSLFEIARFHHLMRMPKLTREYITSHAKIYNYSLTEEQIESIINYGANHND